MTGKPSDDLIELVAPTRDIDGLVISDARWTRNVAGAEPNNTARIPRGGPHAVTLVAVQRYWDGGVDGAGTPGHYVLLWPEFKALNSRWRLAGVRVRAEEAARITRDMLKGKASRPGRSEPKRPGGKTGETEGSELRGAPTAGGYTIFVRHAGPSGEFARTRGVEILAAEQAIVASLLTALVAAGTTK